MDSIERALATLSEAHAALVAAWGTEAQSSAEAAYDAAEAAYTAAYYAAVDYEDDEEDHMSANEMADYCEYRRE